MKLKVIKVDKLFSKKKNVETKDCLIELNSIRDNILDDLGI